MVTWSVEVLVRVNNHVLGNSDLEALADVAEEEHDWLISRWELGNGFRLAGEVEAATIAQATATILDEANQWVDDRPFDAYVASVRAVEPEIADLEAEQPTAPELVSAVEAAEILHVSRQRVHELSTTRGDFPAPLHELRTGPLWVRSAIEAFNEAWERKPGRPRKASSAKSGRLRAVVSN